MPQSSKNEVNNNQSNFLEKVLSFKKKTDTVNSHLIKYFKPNNIHKLSMHYNAVCYNGNTSDPEEFLRHCAKNLTTSNCKSVCIVTSDQCKNNM